MNLVCPEGKHWHRSLRKTVCCMKPIALKKKNSERIKVCKSYTQTHTSPGHWNNMSFMKRSVHTCFPMLLWEQTWQVTSGLLCCCRLFPLFWPVLWGICSFIPQHCASALCMHSGRFHRWRVKLNPFAFELVHSLVIRDAPMYRTVIMNMFCQKHFLSIVID